MTTATKSRATRKTASPPFRPVKAPAIVCSRADSHYFGGCIPTTCSEMSNNFALPAK